MPIPHSTQNQQLAAQKSAIEELYMLMSAFEQRLNQLSYEMAVLKQGAKRPK